MTSTCRPHLQFQVGSSPAQLGHGRHSSPQRESARNTGRPGTDRSCRERVGADPHGCRAQGGTGCSPGASGGPELGCHGARGLRGLQPPARCSAVSRRAMASIPNITQVMAGRMTLQPPQPLAEHHRPEGFEGGDDTLNRWLQQRALGNPRRDATRTVVVCHAIGVEKADGALASGAEADAASPGASGATWLIRFQRCCWRGWRCAAAPRARGSRLPCWLMNGA